LRSFYKVKIVPPAAKASSHFNPYGEEGAPSSFDRANYVLTNFKKPFLS
jgi:hypothetical protein